MLALLVNVDLDQSYTPFQVSVRTGTNWNDVETIVMSQLDQPRGWNLLDLRNADGECPFVSLVQLVVHTNHDQGRDSHVRLLKIYAPSPERTSALRMQAALR